MKPNFPQSPGLPGFSKEQLKQELKLDKFDQKLDKLDLKLDKEKDKQKDKMPNNYTTTNYQPSNYNNLAAPVEVSALKTI